MRAFGRAICIGALWIGAATAAQTPPSPGADESAVRAAVRREIDAWAKFDPAAVSSCFTEDVVWQNPFGVRIRSRALLTKFLTNLFQRPGYRSAKETAPPRITDVRLLSPTSAVAWTKDRSEGQVNDATGKPMLPRYSHVLEVLVKKDGVWLISDSLIMDEYPRPAPTH